MNILPFARLATRTPRKALYLALCFVGGLATAAHADNAVLYTQPPTDLSNGYYSWSSNDSPAGLYAQTFDNFALSSAGTISAVDFEALYIDLNDDSDNPAAPNTTSFEISFWSDNGGQPGTELSSSTISLADANPTSLDDIPFPLQDGTTIQASFFSYHAALTSPFTASAGTTYWISILSHSTAEQPTWSWYSTGTPFDGTTCFQEYPGGSIVRPQKRAFTLEGGAVTTPTLTCAATTPVAHLGGASGVFTFTLSAPQTTSTKIHYKVTGTALNGTDYTYLGGVAKIKPGKTSVNVQVIPQGNLEGAVNKKIKLAITPESAYTVGTDGNVQVKIVNH